MANYYATARSNYFKVKDKEKFKELCEKINVEMIENSTGDVGFICTLDPDCGGLPSSLYDEKTDEFEDFDLCQELAPHLEEGEVAVMMEAGNEKYRYVVGMAMAVNWKGEETQVNIDYIYRKAKEELGGKHVSMAQY